MNLGMRNTLIKCEVCGEQKPKHQSCKNCEKVKRLLGVTCPCCKSGKINEGDITRSNNVLGSGYHKWSIFNYLFCENCGVIFFKVETDGKEQN